MHKPVATYRLQFSPGFGFSSAEEAAPYLSSLGISTIYASPVFMARTGSDHGYDITDPTRLNPELGNNDEFRSLTREVHSKGMSWLQDFVPNHTAYSMENSLLADVLACGRHSKYFRFFDIDLNQSNPNLKSRILAPFLGTTLKEALDKGEVKVSYAPEGLCVTYYDLRLPLNPSAYRDILGPGPGDLERNKEIVEEDRRRLLSVLDDLKGITSGVSAREGFSKRFHSARNSLRELYQSSPVFKEWLEERVTDLNRKALGAGRESLLQEIIFNQFYRLCHFRVAMQEINYRRFFTINDLMCLNMENHEAFEHVHSLIFNLLRDNTIQGLRIDHLDGLYDPASYLTALRSLVPDTYILVEKILGEDEKLPEHWPVQGSTGYDYLSHVNGLFVDSRHEDEFTGIYEHFLKDDRALRARVAEKKRLILENEMKGDLENLSYLGLSFLALSGIGNDITLSSLRTALAELLVQFPVYRTYLSPGSVPEQDKRALEEAFAEAGLTRPECAFELSVLKDVFFMLKPLSEESEKRLKPFLMRFQQLCAPLMAKGFEDTYLYVYNRLVSQNEVGNNPRRFGTGLGHFHDVFRKRAEMWPFSLNATSTHDTKRGEDVRARLNVLTELPEQWETALNKWHTINHGDRGATDKNKAPSPNEEYLIYQMLVGAFPFDPEDYPDFRERIRDYLIKAVREAKIHSEWINPQLDYEEALKKFMDRLLPESGEGSFLKEFASFQRKISKYGIFNSLSQTLLKLTLPGVPDFYQGTEFWDLNLVDPDNRRPVNFEMRDSALKYIQEEIRRDLEGLISELLRTREDGRIKLFLIFKVLEARRNHRPVFESTRYVPLAVKGRYGRKVIAFARNHGKKWLICLAPRFLTSLIKPGQLPCGEEIWEDTKVLLPDGFPGQWQEILTHRDLKSTGDLAVGEVLQLFPGALLISKE